MDGFRHNQKEEIRYQKGEKNKTTSDTKLKKKPFQLNLKTKHYKKTNLTHEK